jgi:hypothetical protein
MSNDDAVARFRALQEEKRRAANETPVERHRRQKLARDRRRRSREADARRAAREYASARRAAAMRRVIRDAYHAEHPPLPGEPLDLRLRVLGMSLRELSERAGLGSTTLHRIERGDPTVSGPSLRQYVKVMERLTRRRMRVADVRPAKDRDDA